MHFQESAQKTIAKAVVSKNSSEEGEDEDELLDSWGDRAYFWQHPNTKDVTVITGFIVCDENMDIIDDYAGPAGMAIPDTKYKIIIMSAALTVTPTTLAHELGHNCGLGHTPATPDYNTCVMYPFSGNRRRLQLGERDNFE